MTATLDLLKTRRSVPPALLDEPGPDRAQLDTILTAAARVPDHGKLAPWRFIVIAGYARAKVGEVIAQDPPEEFPRLAVGQFVDKGDMVGRAVGA